MIGPESDPKFVHQKPISWIEPAKNGDPKALDRALESFRPYLTMIASRLIEPSLATKFDPDDLVQETFLVAHRDIAGFRGSTEAEWRAWLKSILVHRSANLRRDFFDTQKRRGERAAPEGVLEDPARGRGKPTATPSACARLNEMAQALEAALGLLPDHYRAVVHSRYSDGLSFEAAGSRLGVSAEAARKLWTRALGRLQKILGAGHAPL